VAGTGTFLLAGQLSTDTGGVTINANAVDLNAGIDTTSAGAAGTVAITGATGIDLGGDITTDGAGITLNSAVTLSGGPRTLSTGAGAGAIDFGATLDGAQALALTSGTGDLGFGGDVGNTTELGAVTIHAANAVAISGIFKAASLTQDTTGSGTFTPGPSRRRLHGVRRDHGRPGRGQAHRRGPRQDGRRTARADRGLRHPVHRHPQET
jgi:hypothetical protein